MEVRLLRVVFALTACCLLGANYRTEHFIVSAPDPGLAEQVGNAAEHFRDDLARQWLGKPLGPWADICPIEVHVESGAGGQTSFEFPVGGGHPRGWQMIVKGPPQRILDSVLPHEILHTVFATHFQQPLPRWADEGACTTVEHVSERQKHEQMLVEFLTTNRGIPFNEMYRIQQYPRDILPLYAQGHSVARYLIAQGGKQKFVQYVEEGMGTRNWPDATRRHYGFDNLSQLQLTWVDWVGRGSPPLDTAQTELLAARRDAPSAPAPRGSASIARVSSESPVPRNTEVGYPSGYGRGPRVAAGDGWYARQAEQALQATAARRPVPEAPDLPAVPAEPSGDAPRTVIEWSRGDSRVEAR